MLGFLRSKEPKQLEGAKEAFQALEDPCQTFRHMKEGKEAGQVPTTAAANKMFLKDSDSLAL